MEILSQNFLWRASDAEQQRNLSKSPAGLMQTVRGKCGKISGLCSTWTRLKVLNVESTSSKLGSREISSRFYWSLQHRSEAFKSKLSMKRSDLLLGMSRIVCSDSQMPKNKYRSDNYWNLKIVPGPLTAFRWWTQTVWKSVSLTCAWCVAWPPVCINLEFRTNSRLQPAFSRSDRRSEFIGTQTGIINWWPSRKFEFIWESRRISISKPGNCNLESPGSAG